MPSTQSRQMLLFSGTKRPVCARVRGEAGAHNEARARREVNPGRAGDKQRRWPARRLHSDAHRQVERHGGGRDLRARRMALRGAKTAPVVPFGQSLRLDFRRYKSATTQLATPLLAPSRRRRRLGVPAPPADSARREPLRREERPPWRCSQQAALR
jgi:hypothetical protein